MEYSKQDCINDTEVHIENVKGYMQNIMDLIYERSMKHDASKLQDPELSIFTEYTPKLANTTYGSEEYKEHLKGMQVALDHHYASNSHHPEHYDNGVNDMDLLDIVEMLCDWKAATERHNDGDIMKSLEINKTRFNIDDQLFAILENTVKRMEWL